MDDPESEVGASERLSARSLPDTMAEEGEVPQGSSAGFEQEGTSPMAHPSRRRYHRLDARGRCFAQLGDGWEASVVNVSAGGMLLRMRRVLTPGSSYLIKLLFGQDLAVVEARVLRADRGEEECLMALEFLSISQTDRGRLLGYVRS